LAVGTGLVVAGLGWLSPIAALPVVGGLALAIPPLRRLLPRGTFRASPGLPAAVAARGLQTFAFFGAQNFLTLALVELRGQKADVAGLSLVGATLSWTAGAWLQDRVGHVWGRRVMVARGFALLLVGAATTSLLLFPSVPAFIAAVGWAIAGLGMGMAYGGLSLIVLAEAPPGKEGTATSAMQLSDVFGMAIGTGLGGAALALGEAAVHSARPGVTVAFALSIAAAALAFAAARRLPGVADDSPHGPSAATIQPAV
jgi:MFS family permease